MANGYIGKISAIVTANTADLSRKLSGAVADVDKFANKLNASISRSANAAGASFDKIFTPLQKLERQFAAGLEFNLRTEKQVLQLRQLVSASEQVAKPLERAAQQTTKLSAAVAGEFQPALVQAQRQVKLLETAIDTFGSVSERSFTGVQRRVEVTAAAIRRLAESNSLVSGLASGAELRFQQPAFVAQASRAADLQRQAAALSPEAIEGGGVAALVGRQRQAAEEAERLLATLERIRVTRSGDAAAAEAAYNSQIASLRTVNDELEREIALSRQAAEAAENIGATSQRASTADPTGRPIAQRLQDIERLRQAEESLQRERELQANVGASTQRASAADPSGRSIAQRLQDIERLRQAEESLRRERELQANIGASTQRFSQLTGNRDPRQRTLDNLGGEIDVLRRRVGGLAEPLRETVGPAVDALTTRFQNLARSGIGFTADEARRLSREVAEVNAALASRRDIGNTFRQSFGGAGAAGIGLGVDERALRAIGSQIEFVQGRLAGLAQEARGPVIAALDALRTRAASLFDGGALDTEQGRRELQLLREELVRLLAAAGAGTETQVRTLLNRAGDVARGGADKASLALQQAAFAVEDFFSVTGGLDQRIRAAGNNLSQLGFIVGNTTGLVLGISAAIGGQLVAALIKWYNAGVGSEEQAKALNETLARQKSLVEDLAQAFRSLGETISRRAFSAPAQEAREFARELEEIGKRQREIREGRVADGDPAVQRERGIQAARQRELDGAVDPGVRIRLQREIEESARRERQAARGAVAAPPPDPRQVIEAIASSGFARRDADEFRRRFANAGPATAQRELERRIDELIPRARTGLLSTASSRQASDDLEALKRLLTAIQLPDNARADEAIRSITQSANGTSLAIESAQKDVADAIRAGVPGARLFESQLNSLGDELEKAFADLETAQRQDPSTFGGAEERDAFIRDARARVNRLSGRRDAIDAESERLRNRLIVDPQSTFENRASRIGDNLSAAGAESGQIARRLREIEARRATLERTAQRIQQERPGDALSQQLVRRSEEALNDQVRGLLVSSEALRRFTEALNAAASEAASNLGAAQQRADEARRADLARSTPETVADRAQADRDLREQQQANARVQDAIAAERARLERQALGGGPLAGVFERLEAIKEETDAGNVSVRRQLELVAERRKLEEKVNAEIAKGNAVTAARDKSTEIAERQASARRGEELSLTPAERAAREINRGLADIAERFGRVISNIQPDKIVDADDFDRQIAAAERQQQEAVDRFVKDQERAAAPMVFDMLDAAANVIAQGPRREALGAVDAGTLEGQRELNRLIRGDDPARDVNIVELRKQTQLLRDIRDKRPIPVAN